MVALAGLFFAGNDRVEFSLILGDDAVDALKHLVLLVAAIVGTGNAHELNYADLRRGFDVRSAAHFDVIADSIG